MNLGLCECGEEPAVELMSTDPEDPWPIGERCRADLLARIESAEKGPWYTVTYDAETDAMLVEEVERK